MSWNRSELLQKTIQSLRDQGNHQLEIIVVDNGSTDGSLEWLREDDSIQLIENIRNIGAAAARNQGTEIAKGRFILYMDSDAELRTEGALTKLSDYLESNPDTAGAAGIYFSDEALERLWCWSPCMDWEGNHDPEESLRAKPNPPVLSTCLSLFRRSALDEIGGFDSYFFYLYEDADLCYRLMRRGYRLHVDPEIKILHHYAEPGREKRDEIGFHYYHERLRMHFLLKNWGLRRYMQSWWNKINHYRETRNRFPYLSWYLFVDIYGVRPFLYLLKYPMLRRKR